MKAILFLFLGVVLFSSFVSSPEAKTNKAINAEEERIIFEMTMLNKEALKNINPTEMEKILGRELSFSEVLVMKKAKKMLDNDEEQTSNQGSSSKSQGIAFLLSLFLGGLGIHRFYLGYIWQGVVQLLTAGGLGVWWLIDFIRIIMNTLPDVNGNSLTNWFDK